MMVTSATPTVEGEGVLKTVEPPVFEAPPDVGGRYSVLGPFGLVPAALGAVRKGGAVVCAGIHMSDIPAFPYELLWGERVVRSVANLTRQDGVELFRVAPRVPVQTSVRTFPLDRANEALEALRRGEIEGAAVGSSPARARSRSSTASASSGK